VCLRVALWPTSSAEEHVRELRLTLAGKAHLVLTTPIAIFVAEGSGGMLLGFLEVDLRSHADGCNPLQPVGYIEGWYVAEDYRHRGIGRQLLAKAEDWARGHGCLEMASDAVIDSELSQRRMRPWAMRLLTAACTIGRHSKVSGLYDPPWQGRCVLGPALPGNVIEK